MGKFSLYNSTGAAEAGTAAPSAPEATSSAEVGEGGGLPVTESMAVGPTAFGLGEVGAGRTSFGGLKGVDKSKMVDEMAAKAWRERKRQAPDPVDSDTALQWYEEELQAARQHVEQNLPKNVPVVDTDPFGTGARIRATSAAAPERLTRYVAGAAAPAVELLPDAAEEWIGRNVAAPFLAYGRGIQERFYTPEETGESKEIREAGPITYNETAQGLGVDLGSRFSVGTPVATAAAAGLEKWKAAGWEPAEEWEEGWGDWTQWTLPQLAAATYSGWGTDAHLRKLERGHELMSLRNELDLGRLLPFRHGYESAGATLRAVGKATGDEERGERAAETFTGVAREMDPSNALAAFALSLVDPDSFMGIGAGARLGANVVDAGKSAVLGLEASEGVLGTGAKKAAEVLGVDGMWGQKRQALDMLNSVQQGLADLEALAEAATLGEASARFDVNAEVNRIANSLPRGAREMFITQTQAIGATSASTNAATLKAVRAAQQAGERLQKHFADTVGEIGSAAEMVRQASKDVQSFEEMLKYVEGAERAAVKGSLKKAKADLSVKTALLDFTAKRTQHAAQAQIVAGLKAHAAALRRLGQGIDLPAPSESVDAARAKIRDAYAVLQEADQLRATDPSPENQALFEGAAKAYRRVSLEAVSSVGTRAMDALDEELSLAESKLKSLQQDYSKAAKGLSKRFPKGSELSKDLSAVDRRHKKAIKSLEKAASSTDADQALLGSALRALNIMETGLKGIAGQAGITDIEKAIGQQALTIADAMSYQSKPVWYRALSSMTTLAMNVLNRQAGVERAFGGTSDLSVKAGKMVLSGVQTAQKDLINIAKEFPVAEHGLALLKYMDTTDSVAGSMYNMVSERTIFRDAVPVLRAALTAGEDIGKALDGVAFMFFGRNHEVNPNVKAALKKELLNLLTYGQTKVPKGKDAKAAAMAQARSMTYDSFLLKFFKASVARQTDPELASWVTKWPDGTPKTGISDLISPAGLQHALDLGVPEEVLLRNKNNLERALARGSQAMIHASVSGRTGSFLADQTEVSRTTLKAISDIGTAMHVDAGAAFADAARVMDELGLKVTARKTKDVGRDLAAGIAVLDDPANEGAALVPRAFIERLDERMGDIVNSDEFATLRTPELSARAAGGLQWLIKAQQTSMLTGILHPKPRYFSNIYVGNFTQMWVREGFGTASRVAMDSIGATSPVRGVGLALDKARQKMADSLGLPVDKVFPTITSTLVNPAVDALFDSKFGKTDELVPDEFGRKMTWGQLRRAAWENGVFQTLPSASELARLGQRTKNWKAMEAQNEGALRRFFGGLARFDKDDVMALSEKWADMADSLEQRQRVALFLDLYAKGMSPEEAGKGVNSALYDWNHPMTLLEGEWAVKLFFFWNFRRRALEQGAEVVGSVVKETEGSGVLKAGLQQNTFWAAVAGAKATQMARARDLAKTYNALKQGLRDEDTSDVYTWWAHTQAQQVPVTNTEIPEYAQGQYKDLLGIDATRWMWTVTSATPLESISELAQIGSLIMGWTTPEGQTWFEANLRNFGEMGGLVTEDAMTGVVDAVYGPTRPDYGEWVHVKSPTDVITYRALDGLLAVGKYDPMPWTGLGTPAEWILPGAFVKAGDDGGIMVRREVAFLKNLTPVLATELKSVSDPVIEAATFTEPTTEGALLGVARMFGNLTGLARSYAYDDEETLKNSIKYAKADRERREKAEKEDAERIKALEEADIFGRGAPKKPEKKKKSSGGGRSKSGGKGKFSLY